MKKVLSIILSISLLLTLANTYVFAENDNRRENEHFFVKTIVCPNDYIEYANSNIISFLESHCENGVPNVKIKLGSPFTFMDEGSDVYYFPVMFDDVIRYIFRVYPNPKGSYDATISSFLVEDLEMLAKRTSIHTPLQLNRNKQDIVATIGDDKYILFTYPDDMCEPVNELSDSKVLSQASVVDIKVGSNIFVSTTNSNRASSNSWSHYISLNITETQGSNNWCAAYSTATIVRTLGYGSCTAYGIMTIFYRRPTASDNLSRTQVVTYANMSGLYPIRVENTVSSSTLINDLQNNRPVYFSMTRTGGNHAVVLRGYNSRNEKWSIWNPWFTFYETFSWGGTYVPTGYSSGTYSYTYARTIYHWTS